MKLSQFNFKLPAAQVALYPHKAKRVVKTASGERTFEITRRDESRLMVLHKKSETIEMYKKDENESFLTLPSCLRCTNSRIVSMLSCLASPMNPQVLMTAISP